MGLCLASTFAQTFWMDQAPEGDRPLDEVASWLFDQGDVALGESPEMIEDSVSSEVIVLDHKPVTEYKLAFQPVWRPFRELSRLSKPAHLIKVGEGGVLDVHQSMSFTLSTFMAVFVLAADRYCGRSLSYDSSQLCGLMNFMLRHGAWHIFYSKQRGSSAMGALRHMRYSRRDWSKQRARLIKDSFEFESNGRQRMRIKPNVRVDLDHPLVLTRDEEGGISFLPFDRSSGSLSVGLRKKHFSRLEFTYEDYLAWLAGMRAYVRAGG